MLTERDKILAEGRKLGTEVAKEAAKIKAQAFNEQIQQDSRLPYNLLPVTYKGEIVNVATVDPDDYEDLKQYVWHLEEGYACGGPGGGAMHRRLMGLTVGDGKLVDHKNGNPLDNRRSNLRVADHTINARNKTVKTARGYRNVSYDQARGKWTAAIQIGSFDTEVEAALASAQLRYALWENEQDCELIKELGGTLPGAPKPAITGPRSSVSKSTKLPRKQAEGYSVAKLREDSETPSEEEDGEDGKD